jgi:hypothetical protein
VYREQRAVKDFRRKPLAKADEAVVGDYETSFIAKSPGAGKSPQIILI